MFSRLVPALALTVTASTALAGSPVLEGEPVVPSPAGIVTVDEPGPSDPFFLDAVSLDGTTLQVDVSYAGGCAAHTFELTWNGLTFETHPAQVDLVLVHDAGGDNCEAFLFDSLTFDLSSLTQGNGDLIVNVIADDGQTRSVTLKAALPGITMIDDEPGVLPSAGDGYLLQNVSVDGSVLTASVVYGGGCEDHEFTLLWDGLVMESFPPQVALTLAHDAHDDKCKALLKKDVSFDISALGGGPIIVRVAGPGAQMTSVTVLAEQN